MDIANIQLRRTDGVNCKLWKFNSKIIFDKKKLTCISFTTSGLEKPNISEPVLSIFSPPPSAPELSELLVCIFFILLYILFQQSDGVDPSNCKGKQKEKSLHTYTYEKKQANLSIQIKLRSNARATIFVQWYWKNKKETKFMLWPYTRKERGWWKFSVEIDDKTKSEMKTN